MNNLRQSVCFLLCASVLGALAAQPQVSPAINRTREGNSAAFFPFFGTAVPDEYLQLHGDVPGVRVINALALRPDGTGSNAASMLEGRLELSNAAAGVSHAAPAPTFLGNHGSNRSGVMNIALNFPAQSYSAGGPLPRSFAYTIPLPTPFTSNGSSDLVWHLTVNRRLQVGSGLCDAVQRTAGGWNAAAVFGAGCRSRSTSPAAAHAASMLPAWRGGTMSVTMGAANMVPNQSVLFTIGVSPAGWQGLTLPFELPGTRTAPSGPCFVHASWDIVVGGAVADSAGLATVMLHVPEPRTGINLYSQSIGLAPNANPWQLITSNAVHTYLAPPVTDEPRVGFLRVAGSPVPHAGYVVELR